MAYDEELADRVRERFAVEKTGCRTMDFTKRPMKGYIFVDETGMRSESELDYWINLAIEYNGKAKSSKKAKKK